ncbi:MAG: hypothetical protein H6905_02900 [Hyphomicrobiales bacterium]|nr:hypothetical protein [Hyphomicrobiales bacterium]
MIDHFRILFGLCTALIVFCANQPVDAADRPFETGGLRIGSSVEAVQSKYPKMFFERTPYLDKEIDDRYKNFYGSVVLAEIKGSTGYQENSHFVVLNVAFTGAGLLHRAEMSIRENNTDCHKEAAALERRYGKADSQESDRFRLWRQGVIGDLTSLEFRCFQDGYRLLMRDHDAQEAYLKKIKTRLQPYVEQELQRLR